MGRTTLTLDADLVRKLKELAQKRGQSFTRTLNEIVRRGLAAPTGTPGRKRFKVEPHAGGFRPGIDPRRLNQLVDELEVEDFVAETRR